MEHSNPSRGASVTIDDNTAPWYLQTTLRLAQAEIPQQFDALATIQIPHFEEFNPGQNGSQHSNNNKFPKDVSTTMLVIGEYDDAYDNQNTGPRPVACAFVYGEKRNQVGFCYKTGPSTIMRLSGTEKRHIDFEESFCDLGDRKTSQAATTGLVRSLVLYYFLVTGNINGMGDYKLFWPDFKRACGWIANKGSRPILQPIQNRVEDTPEQETDAKVIPQLSPQEHAAVDDVEEPVIKRQRQDDSEEFNTPHREHIRAAGQAYDNMHRSASPEEPLMIQNLEARIQVLESANALLQTQNAHLTSERAEQQSRTDKLTAEMARLEEHRDYVRNAYDGLKHKHDQLAADHPKTVARALAAENKAKESAEHTEMLQARAERAEQRAIDIQTKHDDFRTKIFGHIREVGNELFALSEIEHA